MTQTMTTEQTAQVEELMGANTLGELRALSGSAVGTKRENATLIVLAAPGETTSDEAITAPKGKKVPAGASKEPKPKKEKVVEDVTPFQVTWNDETYDVAPKRRSARRAYVLKDGEEFDASTGLVINRWGRPKRAMPVGDVHDAKGKVLREGALAR